MNATTLLLLLCLLLLTLAAHADDHAQTCSASSGNCKHPIDVTKEKISPGRGPPVTPANRYRSHVTLYIEHADGTTTPSGWSTRVSDGAAKDEPFTFQPGRNLIEGWTEGVLLMKEGERAKLRIPSKKGYGGQPMGSKVRGTARATRMVGGTSDANA